MKRINNRNWVIEVLENGKSKELLITFPVDSIDQAGWDFDDDLDNDLVGWDYDE